MAFQLPDRPVPLSPENGPSPARRSAAELLRAGELCQPLLERLNHGRDQAALDYLARETSLDVLNECVRRIPDQQLAEFLLDQVMLTASLLASEAFTGIEIIRDELKELALQFSTDDPDQAISRYERRVEKLGQYFFALGRRIHQLENFMASCPLTGSSEQLRGLYGQRVRDLAGDVRFMRQELSRWVRRFVPLKSSSSHLRDVEFLEGRLDAVVDELGLRLREVHETLSATLFEQLRVLEPTLTRRKLFQRDPENVVDVGRLLDWLGNLLERTREFDEGRRTDQLERVKTLLREFQPREFLSFSGLRESDQALFLRCIDDLKDYEPGELGKEDDPVKLFLLLTGDFIATLRRQYRDDATHG